MVRAAGLLVSAGYAGVIVWLYTSQPQTMAQVTGGLAAGIGAYRIDEQAFADALGFFRKDQFEEARAAFERADPAERDPRTQFYLAYSYYRQGWGRVYHDDELFKKGLERIDKAIAAAPGNRIVVDDPNLGMRSADELRAELQRGLVRDASDFNPMKLFRERK
jgi:tetratricopeptide (TPR) repeat protein